MAYFETRVLFQALSKAPPGSEIYLQDVHREMRKAAVPAGVILGPFLLLGPSRWGARIQKFVTTLAFQLLARAGWEMVMSKEEY